MNPHTKKLKQFKNIEKVLREFSEFLKENKGEKIQ